MKAYLKELSSKLLGSVTDNPDILEHFSTDSSIFQVTPSAVVYPNNTADVRKTVQFVAERAEAGKVASLTPRGKGSDQGGGAIGEGMQLVFPAHMNKLLRLEKDFVVVQPGVIFRTLQQTLHTHGRYIPAYPESLDYSTLGGAVSNNTAGIKSIKHGPIGNFVKGLKVILADGSIIETHRISSRELNRKKGLSTLEGEIYRKFDSLLLDHAELIQKHQPRTTRNNAGYALGRVRKSDGSFDLSQVFIGAQGTLGVITEITLRTLPFNPRSTLLIGYFGSVDKAAEAIIKLRALEPSAIEMVDHDLLEYLHTHHPGDLEGLVPEHLPKVMLLVEFDDYSQLAQKVRSGRAQRLLKRLATTTRTSTDPIEQVALWKIRLSAATVMTMGGTTRKALPFIEDASVPVTRLAEYLDKTYKLLRQHDIDIAIWGHAGDGQLRLLPFLDLSKKKDADKLIRVSNAYHDMVIALGGTPSSDHNDGLLRATYLTRLYGEEMLELLAAVKHVFDPLSIFNPHKKTEATEAYAREHLRHDYATTRHYDHM
jgi:FAD/FMN-containing dehydrogenase